MFLKTILGEVRQFLTKVSTNTHKEGYIYIFIGIVITLISFNFSSFLGCLFFIVTLWCIYFFRDPERITGSDENVIVSPADGIIVDVSRKVPPSETGILEEMNKISVFLNIFNVHVNRVPIAGTIEDIIYHKGKFLNASLDKASEDNERNTLLIQNPHGKFIIIQIAGLIARRIVCYPKKGDIMKTGDRYGIIKFGSRVDLYFPKNFKMKVQVGQTMIGGETIIAEKDSESSEVQPL